MRVCVCVQIYILLVPGKISLAQLPCTKLQCVCVCVCVCVNLLGIALSLLN